jgi:hypothetical protein
MCLDITSYEIKEHTFFGILFFCVLTYYICKNIVKIFFNNDMVEVQTWAPLQNNMMRLHY